MVLNRKLSTRVALQEKESIHIDLQNKPLNIKKLNMNISASTAVQILKMTLHVL